MYTKTVVGRAVLPGIAAKVNGTKYIRVGLTTEDDAPAIIVDDNVPLTHLDRSFDGPKVVEKSTLMLTEASLRPDNLGGHVITGKQGEDDYVLVLYTVMSLPYGRVNITEADGVELIARFKREFKTLAGNTVELLTVLVKMDPYSVLRLERTGYAKEEFTTRWAALRRPSRNDYLQAQLEELPAAPKPHVTAVR